MKLAALSGAQFLQWPSPRRSFAEGQLTRVGGVRTLRSVVNAILPPRFQTDLYSRFRVVLCVVSVLGLLFQAQARNKTRHVILVTTDGLRQEEVFQGAEEILISKQYGNVG